MSGRRSFASLRQPLIPSHKFQVDAIIIHHKITGMIAPDCAGFDLLHFLRHDAHISGSIAALVAEAIEFETVVEPDKRDDVLLKADVGTTPAAAPASATPATTTPTSAAAAMSTTSVMSAAPAAAMTHVAAAAMSATGAVSAAAMSATGVVSPAPAMTHMAAAAISATSVMFATTMMAALASTMGFPPASVRDVLSAVVLTTAVVSWTLGVSTL
jgi:hypothetical protein